MPPQIVATSDLHVHPFKIGSADGGADRLADGLAALRQSLEGARRARCPWLFCGDLKQPKHVWPQDALNGVIDLMASYGDVPKFLLPGNHDGVFGEFGSGLAPFGEMATVYDEPDVLQWKGLNLAFWPYGSKRLSELPAFFVRAMNELPAPRILVAHLMFRGVALGPTDAHLPGAGATVEDFAIGKVFDLAICGDIHKGQIYLSLGRGKARAWKSYTEYGKTLFRGVFPIRGPREWGGEIIYPGSPYMQSWGEVNEWPKGFLLIDVGTGEVQFVGAKSPRFRAVEVGNWDMLRSLAEDPPRHWEGDVVRLYVAEDVLATRGAAGMVDVVRAGAKARDFRAIPRRAPRPGAEPRPVVGLKNEELFAAWADAHPLPGVGKDALVRSLVELSRDDSEGDE